VVGATGAWVVKSWQPGWLPLLPKSTSLWRACGGSTSMPRGLRGEAAAVADALASDTAVSVRPLLCTYWGLRLAGRRLVQGIPVARPRQLTDIVRTDRECSAARSSRPPPVPWKWAYLARLGAPSDAAVNKRPDKAKDQPEHEGYGRRLEGPLSHCCCSSQRPGNGQDTGTRTREEVSSSLLQAWISGSSQPSPVEGEPLVGHRRAVGDAAAPAVSLP
jgi:hypothetical protein